MKLLSAMITLCFVSCDKAEPLANGTAYKVPNSDSFMLRFKVAKEAKPGLQFYPNVRFVFDDGNWIAGHAGCFPSGASAGQELGGDLSIWDSAAIPRGRTLDHVAILAIVGSPTGSSFGFKQGDSIPRLDDRVLANLENKGGVLLQFPIKKANKAEQATPRKPSD